MNNLIKKLSPSAELIIVLILGFGLAIYSSTTSFLFINADYSHSWIKKLTTEGYYFILLQEIISFVLIMYILKVRGWTIKDFNLEFTFRLIWIALLLMFIRNFIGNVSLKIFELLNVVDDKAAKHVQFALEANWLSLILIIVINSVYEEVLLVGYIFKRLEKYHPCILIGLSAILRLSYHTYQGWMILIMIIPMGLIFGYYYYKYKKLWPLIIAHGFSNLIVFLSMQFHWEGFTNK